MNIAVGSGAEVGSLLAHAEATGAMDRQIVAELMSDLTIVRKMLYRFRTAIQPRPAVREAPEMEPDAGSQ